VLYLVLHAGSAGSVREGYSREASIRYKMRLIEVISAK